MGRKCYHCGSTSQSEKPYTHEIVIDGVSTQSRPRPMLHCDGCSAVTLTMNELQEYEKGAAAAVLCGPVPASGRMVHYARRALGLKREELAEQIYCDVAAVEAWEDGRTQIDAISQMALVTLLIPSEVA